MLPRALSFLLLPLYTDVFQQASGYGEYINIYSWIAIFNVFLSYGMETAFFRFYSGESKKKPVVSTALISILASSLLFLIIAIVFRESLAGLIDTKVDYVSFITCILVLDALVIIPFAMLRADEKPMKYAVIKIVNVAISLLLNVFFLLVLPIWAKGENATFWSTIYFEGWEIQYIFVANIIASGITLLWLLPTYQKMIEGFHKKLWQKMLRYSFPVLIAGIAFTINEVLDKILITKLVSESAAGIYAACYKLAMFMTLYGTAFRIGVEPFFFSHAKSDNPQKTYGEITTYFVVLGSVFFLAIVVFSKVLAKLFGSEIYQEAIPIVPIVLLGSFCLGIYHNLSVWYKITDRTKYGAYISVVGALLTIGINLIFIPKIGYWASAWATLIAYGTMMSLSYYFGKKYYPVPYNMRKIVFYTSISLVLAALSFYVFEGNLLIGSLLLLVFLGLVYWMEKDKLQIIFSGQKETTNTISTRNN